MKKQMSSILERNGNKKDVVKLVCFPGPCRTGENGVSRFFVSDGKISVRNKIGRGRIKCGKTPNFKGVGPGLRPSGAPLRSGFTLIELLVVVLIIGILAAVALPQYYLAVDKAKFANLRTLAVSYANAAQAYYQANGIYPKDLEETALDFPAATTLVSLTDMTCAHNEKNYCCINTDTRANGGVGASVTCGQQDMSFAVRIPLSDNKQGCLANFNNSRAQQLCKALGGQRDGNALWPTLTGYSNGNYYKLSD